MGVIIVHGFRSHIWVDVLQRNPEGQQWAKSEQHTAYGQRWEGGACALDDVISLEELMKRWGETYVWVMTAAVAAFSHAAGVEIRTRGPIRACDGTGGTHKYSQQPQSHSQHLQKIQTLL